MLAAGDLKGAWRVRWAMRFLDAASRIRRLRERRIYAAWTLSQDVRLKWNRASEPLFLFTIEQVAAQIPYMLSETSSIR